MRVTSEEFPHVMSRNFNPQQALQPTELLKLLAAQVLLIDTVGDILVDNAGERGHRGSRNAWL